MELRERQLALQILTNCTLDCELCADYSPLYKVNNAHKITPLEQVEREIDCTFEIYDYIEDFTITGGEPLLHKDLDKILLKAMQHKDKFKSCRIFTNATIVPTAKLLKVCSDNSTKIEYVIDHYGEHSCKADDMIKALEQNGITYRVNQYYGNDQHHGGWVDYGSPREYRGYSSEKVKKIHTNCHNANWKNLIVFDGKLHPCTQSTFGSDFNFFTPASDEVVDLFDSTLTLEQKKNIALGFGTKPLVACQYCNGFDPVNSKRIFAGKQLKKGDKYMNHYTVK